MPINASNYEACLASVAKRGSLGQKEAQDIFDQIYDESERIKAKGGDNPIATAAFQMSEALKEKAANDLKAKINNANKRAALIDEATAKGTSIAGAIKSLVYKLVWGPDIGPKENASSLAMYLSRQWASALLHDLGGNVAALRDPAMLVPIETQLFKIHAGEAPEPGIAGDVAKAIYRVQEAMRQRLNTEMGIEGIKNAADFSYSMSHDREMIRRGGRDQPATPELDDAYKAWRDFVIDRLADKTWDKVTTPEGMTEAQGREDFLRKTFNSLLSDVHKTFRGEETGGSPYFEGTYNMARSMSQERTLFWKDGQAAGEYRQRYGSDRMWGPILNADMIQSGRRAGLMHFFGDNPAGNLNMVLRRIEENFKDSDPDGVVKFKDQAENGYRLMKIRSLMARLDGTAEQPANTMLGQIVNTAMQIEDMSMLGNVSLTHLAGLAVTTPTEARWSGIGTLTSLGRVFGAMFPDTMPKAERAEALAELGAYTGGLASIAHDFRGDGWSFPGMVSAANHWFHSMTGLPWIFNRAQGRGLSWMAAQNLANNIPKDFTALEPHLKSTLMQYGIGPEVWNVLKTGDLHKLSNGDAVMTPAIAKTLDAGAIRDMLKARGDIDAKTTPERVEQMVAAARQDIADRLGMYYSDTASHGIVQPDVASREQIANLVGNSPTARAFMQFKGWPAAYAVQKLMQTWMQTNSLGDKVGAFGTMITLGLIAGYARMTAGDLAAGREPRVGRNASEWKDIGLAALAQSGGLGIFGDMLFGEINRMGAPGASALGGPLGTDIGRLGQIYNTWLKADPTGKRDAWPELARFGLDHIPGVNLFYLKDALDYGLLFHLYEGLRPGWWNRTNRQMQREQGRSMLGFGSYHP